MRRIAFYSYDEHGLGHGLRRLPGLLDDHLASPPRPLPARGATTPTRRFPRAAATRTGSVPA